MYKTKILIDSQLTSFHNKKIILNNPEFDNQNELLL